MFASRELLACFFGCAKDPQQAAGQHRGVPAPTGALLSTHSQFMQREETLLDCAIEDPGKACPGLEDLRNEDWAGGMNGKRLRVSIVMKRQ